MTTILLKNEKPVFQHIHILEMPDMRGDKYYLTHLGHVKN